MKNASCPNWIVIPVRESRHFKRSDNEAGEMRIPANRNIGSAPFIGIEGLEG
jgi:hypothetical protein